MYDIKSSFVILLRFGDVLVFQNHELTVFLDTSPHENKCVLLSAL